MGQAKGYKSRLVMDFETAFATEPGTPAGYVMPIDTFNLKSNRPKNTAQTITGTRNPVKPFDGNLTVSGEAVVPVDSSCFAYWLKAMFGDPVTTGTGPYTHTYKVGDLMPSEVMEVRHSDESAAIMYAKSNGCRIDNFSMSVGGDEALVANIGIEAATETISSTPYDSSPTVLSLDRLQNYQASIEEGGAAISKVTEMGFTLDFGLDKSLFTIGDQGVRGEIPPGILSVTGNIKALFDNLDLLNKAINSTESSLVVTFTNGADELKFEFNELQFERNTPGIDGPQGVLIELPFVAYMDDHAAASVVVVSLTNNIESY